MLDEEKAKALYEILTMLHPDLPPVDEVVRNIRENTKMIDLLMMRAEVNPECPECHSMAKLAALAFVFGESTDSMRLLHIALTNTLDAVEHHHE